jgi:diguanylate cyclase (GGDEF)-like protein
MSRDVLVVDDEDGIRRLLIRWLTRWGYQVREAVSASDAIEQMTVQPASILLTDLMMPVHDGMWLTEQVRKRWPSTVVVIASGLDDLRTAEALREQGAVDFITKPLGRDLVRQALARAQAQTDAAHELPETGGTVSTSSTAATSATPAVTLRTMKLFDRRDTSLGVGLIVGTLMIFHEPLRFLFDIAADIESQYHLDLIPALTVFGVVFGFHEYRKQQDARLAGAVALGDARRANERAEELERLVGFGRDLANAVTLDTIRPVLWEYLPSFGADHDFWVLVHAAGRWEVLVGDVSAIDELEQIAGRATSSDVVHDGQVEGVPIHDVVCYPMVVANTPIGVMGVPALGLVSRTARRRMGAAAALVAIAIKNAQLYQLSQDKGTRDSLTKCFNRGYAIEALESELRRAKRTLLPLTVLMFDLDHFKTINDRHGHLVGDRALVEVTQQLHDMLRASDIKCRYGGDEFVVILPETDLAGGMRVAENLRDAVARLVMPLSNKDTLHMTISTGVATALPGEVVAAGLLNRVDQALYQAKESGRNRVGTPIATTPAIH